MESNINHHSLNIINQLINSNTKTTYLLLFTADVLFFSTPYKTANTIVNVKNIPRRAPNAMKILLFNKRYNLFSIKWLTFSADDHYESTH